MDEDANAFLRCVRHPSQFLTGFCSSCLVERLSDVSKPSEHSLGALHSVESEIVEVRDTSSFSEIKPAEARVRKTLQQLFELDDGHGNTDSNRVLLNSNVNGSGVSCHYECSTSDNVGESSNTEISTAERNVASTGNAPPQEGKNNRCFDDKTVSKGWLSSMFMKKRLSWRSMSVSRRDELQERCKSCSRFEVDQLEGNPNNCRSHDGTRRACHHSIKNSWDPPRHSWDGSMVGKAFACSFACAEERENNSRKIRNCLPVVSPSEDPNQTSGDRRGQAGHKFLADDRSFSESSLGELFAERDHEEPLPAASVLKMKGKRVNRWSKVWDWNITSPFRDFVKKRESNSERSLSESWREGRNDDSRESVHSETGAQSSNVPVNSIRVRQFKQQSINNATTSSEDTRPGWLKKRDFQLSRSRSLHYSSPGNFNNGLLRFYLTPLRSSRRISSKSRSRRSRSYAKGLFGLH